MYFQAKDLSCALQVSSNGARVDLKKALRYDRIEKWTKDSSQINRVMEVDENYRSFTAKLVSN